MIKLRKDGKRIRISLSYNLDYIAKIKTMEGYRWHPKEKYWSVPYSDNIRERILRIFDGEEVDIDPSLYLRVWGESLFQENTVRRPQRHISTIIKIF